MPGVALITITQAQALSNLVVEAEDVAQTLNAQALTMRLYKGAIGADRKSAWRTAYSSTTRYVLTVSSYDLSAGTDSGRTRCCLLQRHRRFSGGTRAGLQMCARAGRCQ